MSASDYVLSFDCIGKTFSSGRSDVHALKNVSLRIAPGETVALVGPSGSGKSTLLSLGAGLELPDTGAVVLNGVDLSTLDEDSRSALRNRVLGFVYQNFQLLPTFTALENVTLPLELLGGERYSTIRHRASAALEEVGLSARADHYPAQLSGGEQQRVAVARALVTNPKLVLADEPTGNLDRANAQIVLRLMCELSSRHGAAIVLVTHDEEVAATMGRRVLLRDGALT
jgi:putative ABC transport system ATP-binding protein